MTQTGRNLTGLTPMTESYVKEGQLLYHPDFESIVWAMEDAGHCSTRIRVIGTNLL